MLTRRGAHFASRRWYGRWVLVTACALLIGIVGAATAAVRDRGDGGPTRLSVVTTSTLVTTTSVDTTTTTVIASSAGGTAGSVSRSGSGAVTTARPAVATTAKRHPTPAATPTTVKPTTTSRPSWEQYCAPHCSPNDHTQPKH